MTDQQVGIRIRFDAETGEVKIAAADLAKLKGAVAKVERETRKADRASSPHTRG